MLFGVIVNLAVNFYLCTVYEIYIVCNNVVRKTKLYARYYRELDKK